MDADRILLGDNLELLPRFPDRSFRLVAIDPPFNTGADRRRATTRSIADPGGSHRGFGGRRYRAETVATASYPDRHEDYLAFLDPRLRQAYRLLDERGTLYIHLDY